MDAALGAAHVGAQAEQEAEGVGLDDVAEEAAVEEHRDHLRRVVCG